MKKEENRKNYWVYPTRACNLHCKYCYQPRESGNMTHETALQLIDFLKRDDPEKAKRVQFFGGEPLLAWDIIQLIVEGLKEYTNFVFSVTTNGTLLTRERLEYLKAHDFGFALSLDGPPGITRKTRPGSEKTDIDLIREFYPGCQIIMTLCPENIEDAYRSTLWFLEKGFRSIAHNLQTEKPWPRLAVKKHHEVFRQIADFCIREELNGNRMPGFMFMAHTTKAITGAQYLKNGRQKNICGSNSNLISIDINGDIYPCQDMVTCDVKKEWMIGNIFEGYVSPQRIPLSEMKFPDREACKLCFYYGQCVGGCGPKNLLTCGDRFKPNMNGCELLAYHIQQGLRVLLNTGKLLYMDGKK